MLERCAVCVADRQAYLQNPACDGFWIGVQVAQLRGSNTSNSKSVEKREEEEVPTLRIRIKADYYSLASDHLDGLNGSRRAE